MYKQFAIYLFFISIAVATGNENKKHDTEPLQYLKVNRISKNASIQDKSIEKRHVAPGPADNSIGDKCERMIGSLPEYLASIKAKKTNSNGSISNSPVSVQNSIKTFTLPIGDIKMPIVDQNGTMNAAMNFMSYLLPTSLEALEGFEEDGEQNQEEQQEPAMIKFSENKLHISGINITSLNSHLYESNIEPRFEIGYNIRNCTVTGKFQYKGPLVLTDRPLSGYYKMTINSIFMVASSNLTKIHTASKAYLKTNDFKLNITNLGYIDIVIMDRSPGNDRTTTEMAIGSGNYLLKLLQKLLQKTIKRTYSAFQGYITNTLESECRRSIDCELSQYSPYLDTSKHIIGSQDIANILSLELKRSNLTKISLPNYDHKQTIIGTQATVRFYNGTMLGMNHIYFSGDTRIKLEDKHLYMSSRTGWTDIETYYNYDLIFGNNNLTASKGFFSFLIKRAEFDAIITRTGAGTGSGNGNGNGPGENQTNNLAGLIHVDQLNIDKFEKPRIITSGLPVGTNRVSRAIVNFFMARLESRLRDIIQPALKNNLEHQLNKFYETF